MVLFWKILATAGIILVIAVMMVFWFLPPYIDGHIQRELVNACSLTTGTDCTVAGTRLRIFPQHLSVEDLKIANPKGFKAPYVLQFGSIEAGVNLRSLNEDPVVLRTVEIKNIHLEYQQNECTSNLKKIVAHARQIAENAERGLYPEEKVKIDEIIIDGATVHLVVAGIWPLSRPIDLHLELPTVRILNPRNEHGEYMTVEELISFVAAEIAAEIANHPKVPYAVVHVLKSSIGNLLLFFIP